MGYLNWIMQLTNNHPSLYIIHAFVIFLVLISIGKFLYIKPCVDIYDYYKFNINSTECIVHTASIVPFVMIICSILLYVMIVIIGFSSALSIPIIIAMVPCVIVLISFGLYQFAVTCELIIKQIANLHLFFKNRYQKKQNYNELKEMREKAKTKNINIGK